MRSLVVLLLVAGCQPRTEILLGIATDMRAPNMLDEVRLEVERSGTGVAQQNLRWTLPGIPNDPFALPGSFGLVSEDSLPIEVTLLGLKGGREIVKREARLTLLEGQTLFYRMGLTRSCAENMMECEGGQVCVEGRCEDSEIDPEQLPDYDPELVNTLTCESLTRYIDTSNGEPMPYSEDAAECPYILCAEGTCLDVPPNAKLYRGVCNAVSSFALVVDGPLAGASMGFFRGHGTATANEFEVPIPINGVIWTFKGTFQGDRAYAVGISEQGSIRCDAYTQLPRRYCGTFTRSTYAVGGGPSVTTTGRVAFVRGGDVLFGQYAAEQSGIIGSFDGWPTTVATTTGQMFSMLWRNEATEFASVESGTASAVLTGDSLTGGWTGTTANGTYMIAGTFEADPTRCRATTLPNCSGLCTAGQACIKGVCVGTGQLRFTLEWDAATDIDLHVMTPSGAEISWMMRDGDSGRLDVDDQGGGHLVENVFFTAPAMGIYTVWANNYDGDTTATFKIDVATSLGVVSTFTGTLAADHETSAYFTYTRL